MSEAEAQKVHIRSLQDVQDLLESPDFRTAMALLDAITNDPESTRAYRSADGRDIIDVLLSVAGRAQGGGVWLYAVRAMTAFDDPRVVTFVTDVLTVNQDPKVLAIAGHRLAQEPLEPLRGLLSRLTLQNDSVPRARIASRLLAGMENLAAEEEIRISLLAERDEWETPACGKSTVSLWLQELAGPYLMEARQELEAQGERAAAVLAGHWKDLSEETREWLVRWAARIRSAKAESLLRRALASGSKTLRRAALEGIPLWGGSVERLRPRIRPLQTHADPAIRLGALTADPEGIDWRALLAAETDRDIRCECIARLARIEGSGALPDLLRLVESDEWEVRASARNALIEVGETAREPARRLIAHENETVRVAAAQVLIGLEDEAWLQENVIDKRQGGA